MKAHIDYQFHHLGIPTDELKPKEKYSAAARMYTSDHQGKFKIQWHRYELDSPLHPLLKTLPHVAFKVNDLTAAIAGEEVILGPYEPIDGYWVAVINDHGMPIELIQTALTDDELWQRASNKQGALYQQAHLFHPDI